MKRRKGSKKTVAAAVLLGLSVLLSGCRIGDTRIVFSTNTANRKEVFSLNGEACELTEAKLYLANYKNIYGQAYGVDLWAFDFEEASLEDYIKDVTLNELTQIASMEQIAKEKEVTLTESESEKVKKMADIYYDSLTKEELSYTGVTKRDVELYYKRYALAQKLYESLSQNVNIEVSDDEARVIRIQQIYLTDYSKASQVQQKLANDGDFAAIASNFNEAAVVETTIARGTFPEEVEEIAFNLENGAVSGMIEADGAYYFIRCLNKFEEELTQNNKAIIIQQREKAQFEDAYHAFIEEAQFDLNEELWNPVTVEGVEGIETNSFFQVFDENW